MLQSDGYYEDSTIGMSRLPVEIIDRIIDFLYNDMRSLAMCARVHSQWTASSRHHLYRCLTLSQWRLEKPKSYMLFRGWLKSRDSGQDKPYDLEAICAPNSSIRSHIRTIYMYVANHKVWDRLCGTAFPRLVQVSVTNCGQYDQEAIKPSVRRWIATLMPSITILCLWDVYFHCAEDFIELISEARQLQELRFGDVSLKNTEPGAHDLPFPPRVSTLRLHGRQTVSVDRLVEWTLKSNTAIRTLDLANFSEIGPADAPNWKSISSLIDWVGPSVTRFRVGLSLAPVLGVGGLNRLSCFPFAILIMPYTTVELTRCNRLQSIKIQVSLFQGLDTVLQFLNRLVSTKIRSITLYLDDLRLWLFDCLLQNEQSFKKLAEFVMNGSHSKDADYPMRLTIKIDPFNVEEEVERREKMESAFHRVVISTYRDLANQGRFQVTGLSR